MPKVNVMRHECHKDQLIVKFKSKSLNFSLCSLLTKVITFWSGLYWISESVHFNNHKVPVVVIGSRVSALNFDLIIHYGQLDISHWFWLTIRTSVVFGAIKHEENYLANCNFYLDNSAKKFRNFCLGLWYPLWYFHWILYPDLRSSTFELPRK